MHEVTVVGTVGSSQVGGTSKYAHQALEIRTPSQSYVFRMLGENPFEASSKFQGLCGKTIRASGILKDNTLLIRSYTIEKG